MSQRNEVCCMALLFVAQCLLAPTSAVESPSQASPTEADQAQAAVVYVSVSRGELRSGPSEEFYPTDYLPRGSSLEVHHRTNDNWLGVRPPAGSFSWVPAADAYLLPGGKIVEITSPSAVSWIGTSLGTAKQYRWQVKLKQGEQLGVLGEQSTQSSDGKEVLWYKIAPPSGEFRWIHAQAVSSVPIPADKTVPSKQQPTVQPKLQLAAHAKPQSPARRKSQSQQVPESTVVTAAYQEAPADGAIVLGPGEAYYDGGPMEGDVIYEGNGGLGQTIEGEVILGETTDGDALSGDTFDGSYVEGEVFEGEIINGEIINGEIINGEIIDGEVIYEDGSYVDGSFSHSSSDPFAGWHAMDLGDDGMRFTWLERLYTRARQRGPDPLAADPFDLSMARGTVRPNSEAAYARMAMAGDLYQPTAMATEKRRQRGWRDPRTLRSKRSDLIGAPVAAPQVSSSSTNFDAATGIAGNVPQLTSGLERVANALSGARAALAGGPAETGSVASLQPAETFMNVGPSVQSQSPLGNVNWHGIPPNTSPASVASAVTSFDLNQLQVMLSETVTQPMQLWNLQGIYDSAKRYVEHGSSPIERGQARLLMERIEEFAELAQRSGYLAMTRTHNAVPTTVAGSSVVMAGAASRTAAAANVVSSEYQSTFSGATNFDASGWLVNVVAAGPGQPTHALADQTGRILSYVTAVPGLNLERYVNQAVGVTGLRGYLPQLQSGHIQAQRVVRVQ